MRINIKTAMPMPEVPTETELDTGNLRDLLAKILAGTHFADEIIDPDTGDLVGDSVFDISLNGVPHYRLAQGLDTALHDGDTVEFSVTMLGGG